jgi:hypothetical protein
LKPGLIIAAQRLQGATAPPSIRGRRTAPVQFATLQTMIFEPATLTLHVAFAVGEQPSSAQKLKRLDLAPLFQNGIR